MYKKLLAKLKILNPKQRAIAAASILLVVVLIVFAITQTAAPKRSVAEYCKVYAQEKARISKLPGNTYPSLLFDHPQNDASEFAVSLGRLEKVAPDDIRPDITTLMSLYEKLHKDPSQMTSISFAADPVDTSLKKWAEDNCKLKP
jgi:hypothetical protein